MVREAAQCLGAVLWELDEELKAAAKILKKPALEYITVAQEEFLVEVRKSDATKLVPNNWTRINGTKAVYRYRSPKMMSLLDERDQCQERLDAGEPALLYLMVGPADMRAQRPKPPFWTFSVRSRRSAFALRLHRREADRPRSSSAYLEAISRLSTLGASFCSPLRLNHERPRAQTASSPLPPSLKSLVTAVRSLSTARPLMSKACATL